MLKLCRENRATTHTMRIDAHSPFCGPIKTVGSSHLRSRAVSGIQVNPECGEIEAPFSDGVASETNLKLNLPPAE